MKVSLLTPSLLSVALCNFGTVTSFLVKNSIRSPTHALVHTKTGTTLSYTSKVAAVKKDEYDDFYDDFDPSDYEDYGPSNQDIYSDKYTRDMEADNSDVDLETVTDLISRRSDMKKNRKFNEADRIRDELLRNHGILVRDKDRKWRTGCSEGENYSKWLHGGNLKPRGSFKSRDDFGPNGHDYVLAKDAGPNISSISEEKIHELLAKRLVFKFDRNYDGADAIQAELLSAGVVIDGKARLWRADGQFFPGYAPREFKMLPHDYDISSDLKGIEKLIKERALCRAERLFKRSDEIREELYQKFDVRINDKKQLWTVGEDPNWDETYQPYKMSENSIVPSDASDIEKLVEQRDRARSQRDFAKADAIRDQLLKKYVEVDDKKRIWFLRKIPRGKGKNTQSTPYIRRGGGDLSPADQVEIDIMIRKRNVHKRKKQYADADAIKSRLLKKYGVEVDDKKRQWYIVSTEYCIAHDSAEIDDKTQDMIEQKIKDRALARGEKDYNTADAIKKILLKKHNVVIDDRLKEWSVVKGRK